MAFKMVLDSLEGLPDEVAKEYVEKDGKFYIQVEGMKSQEDFNRLNTSLSAARTEAKGYKEKLSLLGDRKVEEVVELLDKIPELEAAAEGKLDDDKINAIVEGRIKSKIAPLEREVTTLKSENLELKSKVETFEVKEKTRTIHEQVREAAKKAGVVEEAIEDALLLADRVFELDESGAAVVKEGANVTPGLQPTDWLSDLQTKKPHWWGPSGGGGAGGNRNGGNIQNNPFTNEHWNLTEQGRLYKENPSRAETLAKAAGTTVGGPKPDPKK